MNVVEAAWKFDKLEDCCWSHFQWAFRECIGDKFDEVSLSASNLFDISSLSYNNCYLYVPKGGVEIGPAISMHRRTISIKQ